MVLKGKTMKIGDDLYAYVWENPYENNCNTYVVKRGKALLIDPGHFHHLNGLRDRMEKDGISSEGIDLVILTHCHPDHFEGVQAFLNKPVKIAMSREEERYLLGNGKLLFEMMEQPLPEFRMDFYLKEGDLHFGEETFQVYHTPGHSPGSLSIYWPKRKALFTGDLVFYGGVGRTDFLEGDSKKLMESIERLADLDTEILLPGHGEMVAGRAKVLQNFQFIRQSIYPYL